MDYKSHQTVFLLNDYQLLVVTGDRCDIRKTVVIPMEDRSVMDDRWATAGRPAVKKLPTINGPNVIK
jgi:hypothetical protein